MDEAGAAPEQEKQGATPAPSAGAAPVPPDAPHVPRGEAGPSSTPPTRVANPLPESDGGWLDRVPGYVIPLLLVGIPLLFFLLALVVPTFYPDVVWKYYWGPIHADAAGRGAECLLADGVIRAGSCVGPGSETRSGYNLVNTASWAVLLGLCILGTGKLLRHFRTPMDGKLIVAATLWVAGGSLFHVLEDAELFQAPLKYLFITPIIYLMFAVFGVVSLVAGQHLRAVAEKQGITRALQRLWILLALPVLGYLILDLTDWSQVTHYINPIWIALSAIVAFAIAAWRFQRLGRIDSSELVGILALPWILIGTIYLLTFVNNPWPAYSASPKPLYVALWAPVLALALVLAVRAIAKTQRTAHPRGSAAFLLPVNGLIIFAQMVDAFATAIGIDIGGYQEKHVLSAKVIDAMCGFSGGDVIASRCVPGDAWWQFGASYPTFLAFVPLKFLVSILVIYAIDVSNPAESRRHPTVGLVKFAIVMVGIGPGIRDFVRMALGI